MQISQFSVAPSGMVAIDLVLCIPQTVVTKGAKIDGPRISSTVGLRVLGQHAEVKQATRSALAPEIDSKHGLVPSEELSETDIGMKKTGQDKGVKKENKQGTNFFEVPIFLLHVTEDSCVISLFLAEAFVQNQPCDPCIAITCWKPWPWDSVGSTLC